MDPASHRQQPLTVFAVVVLNAVGISSFGVEPLMASQLHQRLDLSSRAVALLLAVELGGSMLASWPAVVWSRRTPARAVAVSAATLFIIANVLSACFQTYPLLLVSRGLAGLAGGTLAILTLMIGAQAPRPTRMYGWWILGQTVLAAAELVLFASLSTRFGLGILYVVMAAGMGVTLPLAWALDPVRPPVAGGPPSVGKPGRSAAHVPNSVGVLLVLFIFYVMANGLWAFAAERGSQLHLPSARVDVCLSAASLISLGGAGLAAWMGAAEGCWRLALAGHFALCVAAVFFGVDMGLAGFVAFAVILQFTWAFTAPLLLAMAARLEPAGWAMAPANFLLSAGLAVGPIVTGLVFDRQNGPRTIAWVAAVVLTCNLAVLANCRRVPVG